MLDFECLHHFIVAAKSNSYVADAAFLPPSRSGSHDIGYERNDWRYLDSYFGGTDFAGQEIV